MCYGGNTSCVSVDIGTEDILILDAGSGIRELGKLLLQEPRHAIVLLSHIHWDHIQGFPFFPPIYYDEHRVTVLLQEPQWKQRLMATMDGTYFPMVFDKLPAEVVFCSDDISDYLAPHDIRITRIRNNHPGLCYGFRIEQDDHTVVYIPDNELHPAESGPTSYEDLVAFCTGADVLIHDAQYVPADMPMKRGWGHSVLDHVCQLAADAQVGMLAFFHHDPDRTDDEVSSMEAHARTFFSTHAPNIACHAAYEGLTLEL